MARAETPMRCSASTARRRRLRSRRPTASSRATTTPTATLATRRPRSASRRSARPTTCSATRRSAPSMIAAAGRSATRVQQPVRAAAASTAAASATSSRTCSAAPPVARRGAAGSALERAARARPRGVAPDQLRPGGARRAGPADRADGVALHDVRRNRREARHRAERLPALRGARHRGPGAGHVLDLPAVLEAAAGAARSSRSRARRATAAARSARSSACASTSPRACTTAAASGSPARARPGSGGGPPGDLYVIMPRDALAGVHAEGRAPRSRGAAHGRRGAARRRGRGADAQRPQDACASRRARATAPSSGCAARAPPRLSGKGNGDIHYRFVIELPGELDDAQARAVDALAKTFHDGDPRRRLFEGVS